MSRKKYSKSEIFLIVQRAMDIFECKRKKDLAKLFGILPQDMTGRIKRGTILKLIETEAYKRNVNFNYILTGEVSEPDIKTTQSINEATTPYGITPQITPETADDLMQKTAEILSSDTIYRTALASNINAFHHALACETELTTLKQRMNGMEEKMKTLEERLGEKKLPETV